MARKEKNNIVLTTSGYEYDKELAKVSIKVIPALQALIANQHDLTEDLLKYAPENKVFLEMNIAELSIVEETIAKAHAKYRTKREELKTLRQDKECNNKTTTGSQREYDQTIKGSDVLLDETSAPISSGLPSAKFTSKKTTPGANEEKDVRRIAIGASIKALSNLLGRELTDHEILVIEKQVDSYF